MSFYDVRTPKKYPTYNPERKQLHIDRSSYVSIWIGAPDEGSAAERSIVVLSDISGGKQKGEIAVVLKHNKKAHELEIRSLGFDWRVGVMLSNGKEIVNKHSIVDVNLDDIYSINIISRTSGSTHVGYQLLLHHKRDCEGVTFTVNRIGVDWYVSMPKD